MCRTTVLAIGNELLVGETLDTNTHWLCQHLTGLGAQVEFTATLPDEVAPIAEQIGRQAAQGVRLVITTGGLGPTADDLTLTAVATSTNRSLESHPLAYEMVQQRYRALFDAGLVDTDTINAAREKLALLPQGALPLANPVGTAPGVLLHIEWPLPSPSLLPQPSVATTPLTIICLPGVPTEMRAIVQESLADTFAALFGNTVFATKTLWIACNDESVFAALLATLSTQYPQVQFKSKADRFSSQRRFKIVLRARGTLTSVKEDLDIASAALCAGLATMLIAVEVEESSNSVATTSQ
jgi:nicotinamide-nucleotide amidase